MTEQKDTTVKPLKVIVIGGGITGISTGLFLRADGHDVTLFEPGSPDKGTSSGNAGVVSIASCVPTATPGTIASVPSMLLNPHGPLMIRWRHLPALSPWLFRLVLNAAPWRVQLNARKKAALLDHAYQNYEQILALTGLDHMMRRPGLLTVFETDRAWKRAQWIVDLIKNVGREIEILNEDEILQVEPGLERIFRHGFLTPESGHILNPGKLMNGLHDAFRAKGGTTVSERVLGIKDGHPEGVAIATANGEFIADRVVITAGAWSKQLLATIGVRVPLEAERGYHVMMQHPEPGLHHPINVFEDSMFLSPMEHGFRLTSGVELANIEAPPDFTRIRHMIPRALRAVKGLRGEQHRLWMGYRPSMPDSVPRLGPVLGHENIFVGFGGGHIGMTLGPTIGKITADLIANRKLEVELAPYAIRP
ncbi:FAD-binding oxidoreductase [Alphaproteobacteria bacterium]|jgi:D-amino-acid dehydrogenase|nr:FAD-binding oxidoreductase [Alphaproteobacteria bacterium]